MLPRTAKTEAPAYFYNEHLLTVEYSFSEYTPARRDMSSSKLWLDILFVHPQHHEAVTIRVAKSTLILCQSKEVIETVVHREIRIFLQQSPIKEYGTAHNYADAMLAQVAA
jgi:hypothetical protein